MKPIDILHTNVSIDGHKVVVIDIELNNEDKEMIYSYHCNNGKEPYNKNDISMFAFINVDTTGNVTGYAYHTMCYYPEEKGEHTIVNESLPKDLEQLCIDLVKKEYIGNEKNYDC